MKNELTDVFLLKQQFIKQQGKELKGDDIKNMDVGQKDMKKGVRTVIQAIFQLPRVNRKKLIGDVVNMGVNVKTGASARFHHMLHLVSGNTEYEKTMQGIIFTITVKLPIGSVKVSSTD